MKDEVGNVYKYLTVLRRSTPEEIKDRPKGKVYWHCLCKCGNEIDVAGVYLRSGNTKSCGCYKKEKIIASNEARGGGDLVGKTFGYLTVIKLEGTQERSGKLERIWICKCKCGCLTSVSTYRLNSGHTTSCGCKLHEQPYNFIDETGNKYGRLTVLEYVGRNNDGKTLWKCSCECGNIKITTGKSLRAGLCLSCGCLKSKGEEKISQLLRELKVNFTQQFYFDDLRDYDKERPLPLYFDFAIFDENKIKILIEYQGEQHIKEIPFFDKYEELEKRQKRDKLKREYCKEKGIKLIEIFYEDFNKIDLDYMKEVILG